ncbi:alpha/beta-hydrolase [Acephala macrosclerotiorum]|nr:alpha/beta-hydrolase [Acephala macrosclerotiorum]
MEEKIGHHPESYVVHPNGKHKTTLILLHGTSTSGPEFADSFLDFPFSKELAKGGVLEGVKVVFPTGSLKKTTVFGGRETCAWFDVHDFSDRTRGEDDQIIGMRESLGYLKGLVKGEVRLLDGKGGKVILGGFSQGCAMGVVGVLSGEFEGMGLGGFAGFSGWLPFRQQVDEVMSRADENDEGARRRKAAVHYIRTLLSLPSRNLDISPKMPILLGHGTSDQKVKYEWALQMQHSLMDMGLNVKARKYEEVAHWYCEEEMKDMVNFLKDMWNLK